MVTGSTLNTADFPAINNTLIFQFDSGNDAESSDDLVATSKERLPTLEENIFSEIRRGGATRYPPPLVKVIVAALSSVSGSNINTADFPVDSGNDADSSDDLVATQNEEIATLEENIFSEGNLDQNPSSSQDVQNVRSNINTADFPVDSGNDADSSDDLVATQNEEIATLEENIFSEGNLDQNPSSSQDVQNVRREPKTYFEASKYFHWTDAMNQEIDTLLRNGTWELVDLPEEVVVFIKPPEGYFPYNNKSDKGVFLALLVYVDDIIITVDSGNDADSSDDLVATQNEEVTTLKENVFSEGLIPRNQEIDTLLRNGYLGICQSKSDYSLYTKSDKGVFLALLVYVDDIIITGLGIHIARKYGMFLNAYSDADWAKCIVTRKSVTGALASVTSEVIWILKFLTDLQIENLLPVSLHFDSNSAIKIAVNPVFHKRTKHLEIDLHFVRETILNGAVKTVKVDSVNQIADILTK
ncbi:hypothetical protein Tco_0577693 [Tanacetum coccineum]